MQKLLLTFLFAFFIFPVILIAQPAEKCITEHLFMEAAKEDPSLLIKRQMMEAETQKYLAENANQKLSLIPKIIPVVVHVIHEGGTENISKAQIEDQIKVLNEDFRRQNADTINTPGPFQAVAADVNVEFRLATKDPNGNCTDGIVRVFSSLTNSADNNVKALSYWPRSKYLNIWVVKNIVYGSGQGTTIGYAQFPGTGVAQTDGVVIRSDYMGTIGTALNNGDNGRVATHEVGHWLNLRHIWGDQQCGTDFVSDTPTQFGANLSNCPLFPKLSNCAGNGTNGDMFMNYMDYTNGSCQNIFTAGQSARMNAALNSSLSQRNNLWTQANLIATGTDDNATPQICIPVADFTTSANFICVGSDVTFSESTWNGLPTNYQWILPGTNVGTSADTSPVVQYVTPGIYDVTLIVSNSSGSDTLVKTALVHVYSQNGTRWVPDVEDFEQTFPGLEWLVFNEGGNAWQETNNVSFSGNYSIWINNYSGNVQNKMDIFITPGYNLTYSSNSYAKFRLAYAIRNTSSTDQLKVFASTSCGQFWNQRLSKAGLALSTTLPDTLITNNFVPVSTQWREEVVSLSSALFSGKPNVMLKFEYTHDTGNNIYIDELIMSGIVGIDENANSSDLNIYPNPMNTHARIEFTLKSKNHVKVTLHDVLGRELKVLAESHLQAGDYHFDIDEIKNRGVYLVRLQAGEQQLTQRIVVQ